jgi:hypothetical protein
VRADISPVPLIAVGLVFLAIVGLIIAGIAYFAWYLIKKLRGQNSPPQTPKEKKNEPVRPAK